MIQLRRSFSKPIDGKVDIKTYNIDMDLLFGVIGELQSLIGYSPQSVWTTATRPSSPVIGQTFGYNTDFSGEEVYTSSGWLVKCGLWTSATRPQSVVEGSSGFNTDFPAREYFDGTQWNQG